MTQPQRPHSHRSLVAVAATFVLAVTTGLTLAAGAAAPASASTPCYTKVINDWFDNGRIDHVYPRHCYREAIAHLPTDVQTYSNAPDDIRAAMLAAFNKKNGGTPPSSQAGTTGRTVASTPTSGAPTSAQDPAKKGVILKAIEWLGPSDAAAVPLPLLVLAGVAFLLLAAAGGSLLNRHLQARRLPPPPQA